MSIFPKSISLNAVPFERNHYHFKTDAPLTIQKQRTVSRCPGITSAPAADRTFAWFYKSATTENTSIHSKSSEQGFDKVEKFRG
ncbi:MAG: hypothetical protein ACLUPV_05310 [Bilophila wadsworthia]